MKTEILGSDRAGIERAAEFLRSGGTVALPTETVYGLAADATRSHAILKIFKAKERPSFDPLIVHIRASHLSASPGLVHSLVSAGILHPDCSSAPFAAAIQTLASQFWPGPLTLILPKGPSIPDEATSGQSTVGIRMPSHPVFQSVLEALSFPLAAPSANRFGRISPTTSDHVRSELEGRIDAILDGGACAVGVESTILSLIQPGQPAILRPGKISSSEIEAVLQVKPESKAGLLEQAGSPHLAPGMLDQHYAPRKPLFLSKSPFLTPKDLEAIRVASGFSRKIGVLCQSPVPGADLEAWVSRVLTLSPSGDSDEAARNLFRFLRILDEDPRVESLIADLPSDRSSGLGAAIADRLNRASFNKPL